MQAFTLKRNGNTTETTAIDQALVKTFKNINAAEAAIDEGLLKEGELFTTIDDDEPNLTVYEQVRALQEEVRALQEATGDISGLLPDDVSTTNLIATVNEVKKQIDALDASLTGGAGKYISSISQNNGLIEATETVMDTSPTQNSTSAVTSGGVYNHCQQMNTDLTVLINNEAIRAVETEGTLSSRLEDLEADPITATEVASEIADEVTARDNAISNAIDALDYNDTAVANQYVKSVSETNGVIAVTRGTLPTFTLSGNNLYITAGN